MLHLEQTTHKRELRLLTSLPCMLLYQKLPDWPESSFTTSSQLPSATIIYTSEKSTVQSFDCLCAQGLKLYDHGICFLLACTVYGSSKSSWNILLLGQRSNNANKDALQPAWLFKGTRQQRLFFSFYLFSNNSFLHHYSVVSWILGPYFWSPFAGKNLQGTQCWTPPYFGIKASSM